MTCHFHFSDLLVLLAILRKPFPGGFLYASSLAHVVELPSHGSFVVLSMCPGEKIMA